MWPGFDPSVLRDFTTFREMVALRRETPDREWPLAFVEEHHALLVVRKWPNGSITAYFMETPRT